MSDRVFRAAGQTQVQIEVATAVSRASLLLAADGVAAWGDAMRILAAAVDGAGVESPAPGGRLAPEARRLVWRELERLAGERESSGSG